MEIYHKRSGRRFVEHNRADKDRLPLESHSAIFIREIGRYVNLGSAYYDQRKVTI